MFLHYLVSHTEPPPPEYGGIKQKLQGVNYQGDN